MFSPSKLKLPFSSQSDVPCIFRACFYRNRPCESLFGPDILYPTDSISRTESVHFDSPIQNDKIEENSKYSFLHFLLSLTSYSIFVYKCHSTKGTSVHSASRVKS
uniref:Uncharacterized protein n=1 Tax=Meloidogyne enterolobii TaxID=390850 RepID=A0A6V7TYT1_MELEN|nr:unnamed protein product [Meloidogyne enterolobii]